MTVNYPKPSSDTGDALAALSPARAGHGWLKRTGVPAATVLAIAAIFVAGCGGSTPQNKVTSPTGSQQPNTGSSPAMTNGAGIPQPTSTLSPNGSPTPGGSANPTPPLPFDSPGQIGGCTSTDISGQYTAPDAEGRTPTPEDLQEFVAAYNEFGNNYPGTSMVAGSARVAYVSATRISWGTAVFAISGATERVILMKKPNCVWAPDKFAGVPFPCPKDTSSAPPKVVAVWHLPTPSEQSCANLTYPPSPR